MKNKKALIYLLVGLTFTNVVSYPISTYAYEEDSEDDFDFFEIDKEIIKNYITKENYEKAKEKGKEYFINCVDFIFYDKEINGVKWDDLSENAKKEIFESFIEVDELIKEIDPDYKDDIDDKYLIFKKYTKEKYYKLIDTIKETIGEDNYNEFVETREKAKEKAKEETSKVKEKIANWYQEYKNN